MRNFMAYFKFERMISALAKAFALLLISTTFAIVGLNWAMGCGEAFHYPDGTWKTGECFLIPHEQKSGVWFKPEPTAKATF